VEGSAVADPAAVTDSAAVDAAASDPGQLLHDGWMLLGVPAGSVATPSDLPRNPSGAGPEWRAAVVPGTVASSLALPLTPAPGVDATLESQDWWYRCTFSATPGPARRLRFDGLATLAEVWLNGERVLESANMFRSYAVDVGPHLRETNELVLCFRSLMQSLRGRRPRPRWKTALVQEQKLRWVRTSLLGRIPGWTPPLPAVGPWRAIALEDVPPVHVRVTSLVATVEGGVAVLRLRAEADASVIRASVRVGDQEHPLDVQGERGEGAEVGVAQVEGTLRLAGVPLWWPHTHGSPKRVSAVLRVWTACLPSAGGSAAGASVEVPLGMLGFRSVQMDRTDGRVQLMVNEQPVFCRGACWTTEDLRALDGSPEQTATTLQLARDHGLNMVRVGGTMTYPSEAFLETCDALGILLWQDLMIANMDLPTDDPVFAAELNAEVTEQLTRLRSHPCLAVVCGGSENQQQAAMMGLPPESRSAPFFDEQLPALCTELVPGVPVFPSTPCEGVLPFHTTEGLTHYYGVGAYRRPLSDARAAGVRFTPECLGFSHVPAEASLGMLPGGGVPPPHHPLWKAGVPRDGGAGWDFEDVRDHYVQSLFGLDPVALRSVDPVRYRAVSRAVTGELVLRTYAEWRRPGSGCSGALVWFLKDLRAGAGWGLIDSDGRPKMALRAARRAWARRAVLMTDEGLNGVALHVHNEHPEAWSGTVEVELFRRAHQRIGFAQVPVELAPFGTLTLSADALLGAFTDLNHTYRFGAPKHDVVVARLRELAPHAVQGEGDVEGQGDGEAVAAGAVLHEDALFPAGHDLGEHADAGLRAVAVPDGAGGVEVTVEADAFLQFVTVESPGFLADDEGFHLSPGVPRVVRFVAEPGNKRRFKAWFGALNAAGTLTVRA
jgi:beta-mannosidase